ncbi:MAG: HDIG domain-containing protein [Candidatus Omnitrophica bacterium]|nr:HDIG domain-containing protein [Candidatus Omnitrophota bacterium]
MTGLNSITNTKRIAFLLLKAKIGRFRPFFTFASGAAGVFFVSRLLEVNFILPVFLLSLVLLFGSLYKNSSSKPYSLLNLTFLYILVFAGAYFVIQNKVSLFYTPFCLISMLAIILFDETVISFLLTLAAAVTVSILAGNNLAAGIVFLTSGTVAIIMTKGARKRSTVINAGIAAGIIQAVLLFFTRGLLLRDPAEYIIAPVNGLACGIIVLGILPIFEHLFKTITNISLLELADFNHPLLNRIMLEAPGTYHHSLIVGNLADAACRAVGANSLLARIGAYYHDAGKLAKPGYFSENQDLANNKHEELSPTISRLIIMNHVKEGVELARKHHLSPILVDFIQQHHGNSLVYYFYRKALESLEADQELKEEGFRYPGPKPDTKEKAIVMLADAVEATVRALKEPTPARIEEVVHKIRNNKFIDGQLDECDLTLKDLEKIAGVFIRVLSGIYHARIDYRENTPPNGTQTG